MGDHDQILELKFFGNGINPEAVKPSEIANLIANFEKLLLHQAKGDDPGIDVDEVLFSFERIENKSLSLGFKALKVKQILVSSYLVIATAFTSGDYSKINRTAIGSLKEIVKFSKKHNCEGSFRLNDETISSFAPNIEIEYSAPASIKGETTVYGKIIRIGGEEPKLHFRTNDEEKLIFDIDEALAKKLSPRLYDFIGLVGVATWDIVNFRIENFEVKRIIDLEDTPITQTFNELKGIIGKYWDEVEDIESYLN